MKITFDTQVDTHEDIRKVLHVLNGILDKSNSESYTSPQQEESSNAGFMNMFGNENSSPSANEDVSITPAREEAPDTAPNFDSFMNLVNNKDEEEKKEEPQLQFF